MSSEQFFLLFPIPPFLGFAEAGQYNKGCENTNALLKHFLQGWVMMDAGPLKELSRWGPSVPVRWGYRQPEILCQQVNSNRQRKRRKALNPAGDLQRRQILDLQNNILQDRACRPGISPFWQPTVNEAQNSLLSLQTARIFGDVKL